MLPTLFCKLLAICKRYIIQYRYIIPTLFIGIGIYGGWLATQSLWPGLHEDGSLFSTVIINRVNDLGNTFSVHVNATYLKSIENQSLTYNKFDRHGQLYQSFLPFIMQGIDYASLLRTIHFTNLILFILSIWLFYLAFNRIFRPTKTMSLTCGVGLAYSIAGILQYLQGRPEHGSVIVIVLFGLIRELLFPKKLPIWTAGILTGILIGISPLSGIYFGLLLALSLSIRADSNTTLIRRLMITVFATVTTWAGLVSIVYQGSLWSLILETWKGGSATNAGSFMSLPGFPFFSLTPFINYWFINPFAPFAIFSYIIAFCILSALLVRTFLLQAKILPVLISAAIIVILFPQFWYVAIFGSALNYNVLALFPAIAIWLLDQLAVLNQIQVAEIRIKQAPNGQWRQVTFISDKILQKLIPGLAVLILSMPGIGYLRNSLMQPRILAEGVSFYTARESYQKLKSQLAKDEVVLITRYSGSQSRSAVVLDGPPWKMVTDNYWDDSLKKIEETYSIKGKYLIFMQSRDPSRPEIPDFTLVKDRFNRTPVTIFGRLVRMTTPGYGFAVYQRNEIKRAN